MKLLIFGLIVLSLSGCSTQRVMKDCEKINDGPYYMCSPQLKVFGS